MSYQIFVGLKFTVNLIDVGYVSKVDRDPTRYSSDRTYSIIVGQNLMSVDYREISYKYIEDRDKDYKELTKKLAQYKMIHNLKESNFIFNI
jgi:hypothetical protein